MRTEKLKTKIETPVFAGGCIGHVFNKRVSKFYGPLGKGLVDEPEAGELRWEDVAEMCILHKGSLEFQPVRLVADVIAEAQEKIVEAPKGPIDIVVGHTYRIRQWEDMERQYGFTSRGNIDCNLTFMQEMRPLCGATVVAEFTGNCVASVSGWGISADMLEEIA